MNIDECKKMPGLAQRNEHYSSGFWSKDVDGVSYNQLHKFWSELSPKARQELLRVDKQALFELARKNMCCSRCNGLLLENFLQIVSYGRSLQQKGLMRNLPSNRSGSSKDHTDCNSAVSNRCTCELPDPAVHKWGCLTTTRDGLLTLLDCYLYAKSFKGLQTVFESARARERERALLYPDACGGGGRAWMAGYGKGHGTRETCALHTKRLSCDTLVDFWSALEKESRQSLLKMKEEDFVERLNYRFECKKFCRDCRRNVIREFKELKELKRMQREPQCTNWFCVADTAFQYEVNIDSVRADWSEYFTEADGYHKFEWGIGTEEGESDILDFKCVGNNGCAQVNGLDLRGLHRCYITLRAFKKNGRSTEISVKAHALRGRQCVHSRIVVGDGFVSIKRGECIRTLFEYAEEAEEEEDEVMIDKDGNEIEGERPQKHAKSPELAREFLLDAATIIFKEQVEKAFREGTARQNAHSIFVCLSSELLEQRVHVACKEIVTLEKQKKLLEEEELEKREEEERKERKRTKEKEKKLRRKERLKEKEREKELKDPKFSDKVMLPNLSKVGSRNLDEEEEEEANKTVSYEDSEIGTGDVDLSPPGSPDDQDGECLDGAITPREEMNYCESIDREIIDHEDENGCFSSNTRRPVHQTERFWKEVKPDHAFRWFDKRRYPENGSGVSRAEARLEMSSRHFNGPKQNWRLKASKDSGSPNGISSHEGSRCSDNKISESYDNSSCSCKPMNGYRDISNISATRGMREPKTILKSDSDLDVSKPIDPAKRYIQSDYRQELRSRSKVTISQNSSVMDPENVRKVFDSNELKHPQSSLVSNLSSVPCSTLKPEDIEYVSSTVKSADTWSRCKVTENSAGEDKKMEVHIALKNNDLYSRDPVMSKSSSSDNCSSCLSEGDINTTSSNNGNTESSSMSDSEDASQHSAERENLVDTKHDMPKCHEKMTEKSINERDVLNPPADNEESKLLETPFAVRSQNMVPGVNTGSYLSQPQSMMFPQMLDQSIPLPVFQTPSTMGYHQNPVSWSADPANGLMPFPHPNHYVYTGPLGYSLNGESPLCMQYGNPLNHSATPFFNSGPVPVFHPFSETNTVNAVDPTQSLEPLDHCSLKARDERKLNRLSSMETPSSEVRQTESDANFSLFHFGGPVALSTRSKSHPAHSKESTVLEEYSLFARSNSLRFSIF